ncbi:MAG: hypothetical protein ACREJQ_05390, partial [bacterium]
AYVRGFHLDTLAGDFSYSGGIFNLKNLSAGMYGGKVTLPEVSINLQPLFNAVNRSAEYTYSLQFHTDDLNLPESLKKLEWLKSADITGKLGAEFTIFGVFGGLEGTTGSGYLQATEGDFSAPDGKSRLSFDLIKLEFNYDKGALNIQHASLGLKDDRWLGVGRLTANLLARTVAGRGAFAMSVKDALLGPLGQKSSVESFVRAPGKSNLWAQINFTITGSLWTPDISFSTPNQPIILFAGNSTEGKISQLWEKWTSSKFGRGE